MYWHRTLVHSGPFAQNPTSELFAPKPGLEGRGGNRITSDSGWHVQGLKEYKLAHSKGSRLHRGQREKGKSRPHHILEEALNRAMGALDFNPSSVTRSHVTLGKSLPLSGPQFPYSKRDAGGRDNI